MYNSEIWRPIAGYEGEYEVSNFGQVRSLDRIRHIRRVRNGAVESFDYRLRGRVLAQQLTFDGYFDVGFQCRGTHRYFRVHRLVAAAFIPNPENKPEVNHKDGNKINNHADNLEWVTDQENVLHAMRELHGVWQGKNVPTTPVKCLTTGVVFTSLRSAAESVAGDPTNLLVAISNSKPYKGHVFLHVRDLDQLTESESDYVARLLKDYRGPFKPCPVRCVETGEVFASITELSKMLQLDFAHVRASLKAGGALFANNHYILMKGDS